MITHSPTATPNDPIEFRSIPGITGYRVSNYGVVESCWRPAGRGRGWALSDIWRKVAVGYDLRPGFSFTPTVWLRTAPNIGDHRIVAQLVLEAFVGPCPPGMEACHNDGIEVRNFLYNLRWDTHVNNCADKINHGTQFKGSKHPNSRFSEYDVLDMRVRFAYGESPKSIGKDYKTDYYGIWQICKRRSRKASYWSTS